MIDLLHEIVRLLPHRQEVLQDLHDRIDEAAAPEAAGDGVPATEDAPEA